MVALKAQRGAQFIRKPDPSIWAVLLHGPDEGLIAERRDALIAHANAENPGDVEVVRLDDRDLGEQPARLAEELLTQPMFAPTKLVVLRPGARDFAGTLGELIKAGPPGTRLIVEAGDLRPSSKLRKIFEAGREVATLPCYADQANDLGQVIDEEASKAGCRIGTDARAHLIAMLGADRRLSRNEVAKLCLYAGPGGEIDAAMIDDVVGDASELALDMVAYAASAGAGSEALRQFDRLRASGSAPQAILITLTRHFQRLLDVRLAHEAGADIAGSINALRPPVHFRRKDALAAHCRVWTSVRLMRALRGLQSAVTRARRQPDLEVALASQSVLACARLATRP